MMNYVPMSTNYNLISETFNKIKHNHLTKTNTCLDYIIFLSNNNPDNPSGFYSLEIIKPTIDISIDNITLDYGYKYGLINLNLKLLVNNASLSLPIDGKFVFIIYDMKIIIFDIDETICKTTKLNYDSSKPIKNKIVEAK